MFRLPMKCYISGGALSAYVYVGVLIVTGIFCPLAWPFLIIIMIAQIFNYAPSLSARFGASSYFEIENIKVTKKQKQNEEYVCVIIRFHWLEVLRSSAFSLQSYLTLRPSEISWFSPNSRNFACLHNNDDIFVLFIICTFPSTNTHMTNIKRSRLFFISSCFIILLFYLGICDKSTRYNYLIRFETWFKLELNKVIASLTSIAFRKSPLTKAKCYRCYFLLIWLHGVCKGCFRKFVNMYRLVHKLMVIDPARESCIDLCLITMMCIFV